MSEVLTLRLSHTPNASLAVAIALQAILVTLIVIFVGTHAWDDGAITLAYSKTFAETGRIALTAASEQVEGFSSVSWFLINAAVALFRPGFEGAILWAQILAGLFLSVATVFLFLIARSLGLKDTTTAAIVVIFSIFGPAISEIANGMEMTLLAASGLAIVYALYFRFNWVLLIVSIVVFLTTRFEAMVYFAGLLAPLLFRQHFRAFALLALFGIAVVGAQEAVRYAVFGDLLPNTIYAKMHAPYAESGVAAIRSRVRAVLEIVWIFWPLLVGAVALLIARWQDFPLRTITTRPYLDKLCIVLGPVLFVEAFSALIGTNLGYMGRMQFFALPFVLLLFGIVFETFSPKREVVLSKAFLIGFSTLTILASWSVSAEGPVYQIKKGIVPGAQFANNGVTPQSFRRTGVIVEWLASLLDLSTISLVTPDAGGVGLCCRHLRIIDIGLLTNRRLAKEGYAAMPAVLAERPDVIEVKAVWMRVSHIQRVAAFSANYRPALINDKRFFLREDHAERLLERGVAQWCPISEKPCLDMVAGLETSDRIPFVANGRFLVLN